MASRYKVDPTEIQHNHDLKSCFPLSVGHFRVCLPESSMQVKPTLFETILPNEEIIEVYGQNRELQKVAESWRVVDFLADEPPKDCVFEVSSSLIWFASQKLRESEVAIFKVRWR